MIETEKGLGFKVDASLLKDAATQETGLSEPMRALLTQIRASLNELAITVDAMAYSNFSTLENAQTLLDDCFQQLDVLGPEVDEVLKTNHQFYFMYRSLVSLKGFFEALNSFASRTEFKGHADNLETVLFKGLKDARNRGAHDSLTALMVFARMEMANDIKTCEAALSNMLE
ncbi:hypothetical protein KA078_03385 [Candidatus Woesebacteria bacterium]|nr:hypothetical protein [Candidatus Woesebacteria bacterium]